MNDGVIGRGRRRIDREIMRIGDLASILKRMQVDEETRHDRLNAFVFRTFPFFLALCCALTVIILWFRGFNGIQDLMLGLSAGFVLGFAIMGVPVVLMSDRGVLGFKKQLTIYALGPAIVATTVIALGYTVAPWILGLAIVPDSSHFVHDLAWMAAEAYFLTGCAALAINAVVAVTVAYLGRYMGRIYLCLEDAGGPDATRGTAIATGLFEVPDIIDVERVELEPFDDDGRMQSRRALKLAFTMFLFGMVVCSNIFLNPFFIDNISPRDMVVIGVLLSVFLPVLIFPWQITEAVGAKVKSRARDYYLWKGIKNKLYQSFFTVAVFILLIFILMYLNIDFSVVANTYLGYMAVMAVVSLLYAFIYFNRHYGGFKSGVAKSFYAARKLREEK